MDRASRQGLASGGWHRVRHVGIDERWIEHRDLLSYDVTMCPMRTLSITLAIYALALIAIPYWVATEILAGRWTAPKI